MAWDAAYQRFRALIERVFIVLVAATALSTAGVAAAQPDVPDAEPFPSAVRAAVAPDGSRVVDAVSRRRSLVEVQVHSAAMDSVLTVQVRPAPDASVPAPVLYLLNGADGGTEASSWLDKTDVLDFFADKQVTLVVPIGGKGSYFTDWRADDPILGRQRWASFLTGELPPIIDAAFHGSGANVIAGISMAGTSVFQLALAAPGLYRAIGSYSGCVPTSDPLGQALVNAVVRSWQGDPLNMWGPPTDPAWTANDPYLHAERLRGTAVYVSTGAGLPGPFDTVEGTKGDIGLLIRQILVGGPMEQIIGDCTRRLRDRLRELAIPADFDFRPTGTHSWDYWQYDLHKSWPMFESALRR